MKLSVVLNLLDDHFQKLTSNLSQDDLTYLKSELTILREKLESTDQADELNELGKNFFQTLSQIEFLKELTLIGEHQLRHGKVPEIEEAIKLKLIKSCEKITKKID